MQKLLDWILLIPRLSHPKPQIDEVNDSDIWEVTVSPCVVELRTSGERRGRGSISCDGNMECDGSLEFGRRKWMGKESEAQTER